MPLINDPDGLSQGGLTVVSDAVFGSAAGASITVTSAGTNLPAVTSGDFVEVRDSSQANNNGLYRVTGSPTTGAIDLIKHATTGSVANPANQGSESIRMFGTNAAEKNVFFDTANLKIALLNGFGSVTVLDNEGVTGQALYSFAKEEWKDDNDLIAFLFPITAITAEQYEFQFGWTLTDESEASYSTTDPSNTRQLIRTAGWSELDTDGDITLSGFGWVTLGNIDPGDQAYYFFSSQSSATNAVFDGPVNEFVPLVTGTGADPGAGYDFTTSTITRTSGSFITDGYLVGDRVLVQKASNALNSGVRAVITDVAALTLTVSGTPFTADTSDTTAILAIDRRNLLFTTRIRVFGKTYDESTSTGIGVTLLQGLTNQVFRFPLGESTDNVINDLATTTVSDLFDDIITAPTAPYDDMTIGYYATGQSRSGFVDVGGDSGITDFGVIVDGDVSVPAENGGGVATAEQIYAFVQARLVGSADINDGSGAAAVAVPGQLAEELLSLASTGNTMSSVPQAANPGGGGTGVKVDSFDANDTNRVTFVDDDGDFRTFPFVASATINFNSNLSTDAAAVFRTFITNDDAGDDLGRDFGTSAALTLQDNLLADVAGAVPQSPGGSSFGFSVDYDGNVQRGAGSAGTDIPITIVAIGLNTGQWVIATGTITRATGQTFSLVAALERNFANP
jgi:hypothetical protein